MSEGRSKGSEVAESRFRNELGLLTLERFYVTMLRELLPPRNRMRENCGTIAALKQIGTPEALKAVEEYEKGSKAVHSDVR